MTITLENVVEKYLSAKKLAAGTCKVKADATVKTEGAQTNPYKMKIRTLRSLSQNSTK